MIKIFNLEELNVEFKPYDRYGTPIKGLYWHNISFDHKTSYGSFLLKFDKDTETNFHEHLSYEEYYVISGEINDSNGYVFKNGQFVSMSPGTEHSTKCKEGCVLLVFSHGKNKVKTKL